MIETLGLELVEVRQVTSPELISRMVRLDYNGCLIEEFVRTEYRSLLHQLRAEAHEKALHAGGQ